MIKYCKYCGKEFNARCSKQLFCCRKCSGYYNNKNRTFEYDDALKAKIAQSVHVNYCIKHDLPLDYNEIKCSVCGAIDKKCKYKNICNTNLLSKKKVLQKLGFDYSKYGTEEVYDEYFKINKLIIDLYIHKELSLTEICKLYNISSESSLLHTFDMYGIKRRNLSNALKVAIRKGRFTIPEFKLHYIHSSTNKYRFKYGWHTSWDNNQVFYRSSYELKYAKYLDTKKIHYKMENFKIMYFDTIKEKYRVAIPDFFIPSKSLLVEIKSNYTYNKQNIIDRFRAYKQQGFDYKLILENIDYGKRLPETSKNYGDF